MVVSAVAVGKGAINCLRLGFLKADPELSILYLEGNPEKHQSSSAELTAKGKMPV